MVMVVEFCSKAAKILQGPPYILVHLPGQNIFCPGQNIFCPRQNIFCPGQNIFCTRQNHFCPRQNIFVPDKNFCPGLNSSYLLRKRIENDFKLWKKFFPWLKSCFSSISQAKKYFLAYNKNFCQGQKCFV